MSILISLIILSVVGTLLWLLLFSLKPITQKVFSQTWHYYTGLIPVFFLLGGESFINPIIQFVSSSLGSSKTSLGVGTIIESYKATFVANVTAKATAQATDGTTEASALLNDVVNGPNFEMIASYVLSIWVIGFVLFFALKAKSYYEFKSNIMKSRVVFGEVYNSVSVIKSAYVTTPMLIGIWKPIIVLPDVKIGKRELEIILIHELIHLRRRDLLVKLIILITNGIHWFNPIAYALNKNMDILCESSCDEVLVCKMDKAGRKFYGETILSMLEYGVMQKDGIYTGLCSSKKNMKRRLLNMINFRKKRKSIIGLSIVTAVAIIGIGGGVAFASNEIKNESISEDSNVETSYVENATPTPSTQEENITNYFIFEDKTQTASEGSSTYGKIPPGRDYSSIADDIHDDSSGWKEIHSNISYDDFKVWMEKALEKSPDLLERKDFERFLGYIKYGVKVSIYENVNFGETCIQREYDPSKWEEIYQLPPPRTSISNISILRLRLE